MDKIIDIRELTEAELDHVAGGGCGLPLLPTGGITVTNYASQLFGPGESGSLTVSATIP